MNTEKDPDICYACDIRSDAECPKRGAGFKVQWEYVTPDGECFDHLCSDCWSFTSAVMPWIKTKAELKKKCVDDTGFKHGKFKEGKTNRMNAVRKKPESMKKAGKDLNTEKIYVRMGKDFKDGYTEESCKKVEHELEHEDSLSQLAMFMEMRVYPTLVGDPKKLDPEIETRMGPNGVPVEGTYVKWQLQLMGEDGVYEVRRKFGDKRRLVDKVQDQSQAWSAGALEDTFCAMAEDRSVAPALKGLKSVGDLQNEIEELKRKEEQKKAEREQKKADKIATKTPHCVAFNGSLVSSKVFLFLLILIPVPLIAEEESNDLASCYKLQDHLRKSKGKSFFFQFVTVAWPIEWLGD